MNANPQRMFLSSAAILLASANLFGADLFVRDNDTPLDVGDQPNADPGAMWVSKDIWVRNIADPAWRPQPFPTATPTWAPAAHQNPEYRDPRLSIPCFVYVRVHNRSTVASTGNEVLRVYWAKASSGLSWPGSWNDRLDTICGPQKLYGAEITKPRKNAADATAAEISRFVAAINQIDTAALTYPGDALTYWDKQTEIHNGSPEHSGSSIGHNPAFLPWHREFLNRLEILLQQVDPTVKMFYWDWTTDPRSTPRAAGGNANLFGTSFMGAVGGGAPGLQSIGAPFTVTPFTPAPSGVARPRRRTTTGTPPAAIEAIRVANGIPSCAACADTSTCIPPFPSDATLMLAPTYHGCRGTGFSATVEEDAHNWSHGYFGTGSDMTNPQISTQDPFFFFLHANNDRLWARWQRDPLNLPRFADAAGAYGLDATHCLITSPMRPWNGGGAGCRPTGDPVLAPWNAAAFRVTTRPGAQSVLSPPIYDNAGLRIPRLQAGESVILQIPWHPPNRADYACFGADAGHFCLLAVIEGDDSTLTTPAGISQFVRANNNVAWKNITIVDDFGGQAAAPPPEKAGDLRGMAAGGGFASGSAVLVQNLEAVPVVTTLRFDAPQGVGIFDHGVIRVNLPDELARRWEASGARGTGVERIGPRDLLIARRDAQIEGIELRPGESFPLRTVFELRPDYPHPGGRQFDWDFMQLGTVRDPNEVLGGVRFTVDINEICLIKFGSAWRYLSGGLTNADWAFPGFSDKDWNLGVADFALGKPARTELLPDGNKGPRTVFFRNTFSVPNTSLVRRLVLHLKVDDGAVVYLNGREVYRFNLPQGPVIPGTTATDEVVGAGEVVHRRHEISTPADLLRSGENVLAVEVHQSGRATDEPDLLFDLKLCANPGAEGAAPAVALTLLPLAGVFQTGEPVQLNADALDLDGRVDAVEFFKDGVSVLLDQTPPYQYLPATLPAGRHQFTVVAYDNDGLSSALEQTVTVVPNRLPDVKLTSPQRRHFSVGEVITLSAEATDRGGAVQSVEFFAKLHDLFTSQPVSLGTVTSPPYTLVVSNLAAGPYLFTAVARDTLGDLSGAPPLHVEVGQGGNLVVSNEGNRVTVRWTEGTLETATEVTGGWTAVPAQSPYQFEAAEKMRFFRTVVHPTNH